MVTRRTALWIVVTFVLCVTVAMIVDLYVARDFAWATAAAVGAALLVAYEAIRRREAT